MLEPRAGSGGESDSSSILSSILSRLASVPARSGLVGGAAGGVGNKGLRLDLTTGPVLGEVETFKCSICFLRYASLGSFNSKVKREGLGLLVEMIIPD